MNELQTISADVMTAEAAFKSAAVDPCANFEAEAGFAVQTLRANDYALKIAMANRQSVIDAVTNIAAIGISLNPARKQAYLVPRDGRICLDISYMGLMDLAMQAGSIRWAQCAIVHAADEFSLAGLDAQPMHKYNPFSKDRGEIVGVYCVIKTCDGDYLTHAMSIDEVHLIREKSQSWVAYKNKKTRSCIWVDFEAEMIRKTCIKQAYKYWPKGEKSDRLEKAVHYMNEQAGEGLEKPPSSGTTITATDGAMAGLSIDEQAYMRELADNLTQVFETSGVAETFELIESEKLNNDQKVALWSLLRSEIRSSLKAEGAARREAAEAIP
jgi:recombination protein RecT